MDCASTQPRSAATPSGESKVRVWISSVGDYEEHGAGFLRFGYDEGPMYVVEITRGGGTTLYQYADQDYERELAPPVEKPVSWDEALRLWRLLANGDLAGVRTAFAL